MKNTFKKKDKLKSRRIIGELFSDGRSLSAYPVKVLWTHAELPQPVPLQIAVSVPKKTFRRAVDRNRIKRKLREAIRLNKQELSETAGMKGKQLALMVLYTGKEMSGQSLLEQKISSAFRRLIEVL